MVQPRSSSSKENTTDTNIGVNRDVFEASNKNTMNKKKKGKTTAEESTLTMVQTRSSSSKENTTDTNIGVNRDVADSSNKNTMNKKKKKKTTAEVSEESEESEESMSDTDALLKIVVHSFEGGTVSETTDLDRAQLSFLSEYRDQYFKKHSDSDVTRALSFEEGRLGQQKFLELVKTEGSEFVSKYVKKWYEDEQSLKRRRHEEIRKATSD